MNSISSLFVSPQAISLGSIATLSPSLATPAKLSGKGIKAAREFEANLIGSLLESMEKAFATLPGENTMPGEDDYNHLGTQALAEGLAARGGFGIAAMISQHLPAHEGNR
jgi:Rod binding domain-containing protein